MNSPKKPFKTRGVRSGKTPDRYFSLPNYQTDGVYIDPNRRKIKQQLENNKKIIHEKPFKVINTRKVEYFSFWRKIIFLQFTSIYTSFPYKEEGAKAKILPEANTLVCQKTFGLFGLKSYKFDKDRPTLTAGNYICSPNETHISDSYERKAEFERVR